MMTESSVEKCIQAPKRWYIRAVNEDIHAFIKTYDFGFIPTLAVNISAGGDSPINRMLAERFKNLRIMKTYGGKVDIKKMPYENNSLDIVITESVLEHVSHVWEAPDEIHRVLKPGGFTIHLVPLMYPRHGEDYFRFTPLGLKDLFSEFIALRVECAGNHEMTNFLMKYRSKGMRLQATHPLVKDLEDEDLVTKKIINRIGYGTLGDTCSNCVWGCFKKGENDENVATA